MNLDAWELSPVPGCFQLLDIGEVLQAGGGFLVRNQVVTRNHKRRYAPKTDL